MTPSTITIIIDTRQIAEKEKESKSSSCNEPGKQFFLYLRRTEEQSGPVSRSVRDTAHLNVARGSRRSGPCEMRLQMNEDGEYESVRARRKNGFLLPVLILRLVGAKVWLLGETI